MGNMPHCLDSGEYYITNHWGKVVCIKSEETFLECGGNPLPWEAANPIFYVTEYDDDDHAVQLHSDCVQGNGRKFCFSSKMTEVIVPGDGTQIQCTGNPTSTYEAGEFGETTNIGKIYAERAEAYDGPAYYLRTMHGTNWLVFYFWKANDSQGADIPEQFRSAMATP